MPKSTMTDQPQNTPAQTTTANVQLSHRGKTALLELLKNGWIDHHQKPNVYHALLGECQLINQFLQALSLFAKIDETRGLVLVTVAPIPLEIIDQNPDSASDDNHHIDDLSHTNIYPSQTQAQIEEDEWSHPLVRRQRLTLEQSLLVAILRQRFIEEEKRRGIGCDNVIAELDDLKNQLQIYLGTSGSDSTDDRKIRTLLEQLYAHGIVSKIDDNDEISIRPLIVHLANPENLTRLLTQLTALRQHDTHD